MLDIAISQVKGLPVLVVRTWDGESEQALLMGDPLLEVEALERGRRGRCGWRFPEDVLEIETDWKRTAFRCFRLEHRLRAVRPVSLSRCMVRLRLQGASPGESYRFVPHLHPGKGMVAADQSFRSPCLILEGSGYAVALLPDLRNLAELQRRGMRAAMTLEGDELAYGITDHQVKGHVFYREKTHLGFPLREGEELTLAYHVFITQKSGRELHRAVNSFLWESEGRRHLLEGGPQELPLEEAAAAAAGWAFLQEENWVDLRVEGRECGGCYSWNMNSRRPPRRRGAVINTAFYLVPRLYSGVLGQAAAHVTTHPPLFRALTRILGTLPAPLPSIIQFQSWFNNLRSAYGAARLADALGMQQLAERAERVRELALAAPAPHGLFPAVLYIVGGRMLWKEGTRAFVHLRSYHLPDSCTTGYHLLEWQRDLGGPPEALEACRRMGEELLRLQLSSGAFPAWVAYRRGIPRIDLRLLESAESAAAVRFLALLAETAGGDGRWLEAARAGGDFLRREVVEKEEWYDYEAFYSCSPKPLGWRDPRSGCRPQCTMSMYWTADAFLRLYRSDGDAGWLEWGRVALDRLLCYQQVWDPPALSINAFGGFSSQNTDAEWNDARQGLVAPLLADWYEATGEWELLERGVAALMACFATQHLGREPFTCLRPEVRGAVSENYAHFGYDAPLPGYLETDWGAGSALYALGRMLPRFGHLFLDMGAGRALGIDGCRVDEVMLEEGRACLKVATRFPGRRLRLVTSGSRKPLEVVVNGNCLGRFGPEELERGLSFML